MKEPRVLVTHAATRRSHIGTEMVHDYSAAERFGTIHHVTLGRHAWDKVEAYEPLRGLDGFDPWTDFILPSGDFASIVAAGIAAGRIAGARGCPTVHILTYSAREGVYRVIEIPSNL